MPAQAENYPLPGVDILDEKGTRVAGFHYGGGAAGLPCGPDSQTITEHDAEPGHIAPWAIEANVRFVYRVLDQTALGKGFSYQVGLVDTANGQMTGNCQLFASVGTAPGPIVSFADRDSLQPDSPAFATMEEARQYMGTAQFRKLKEMIRSMQLHT